MVTLKFWHGGMFKNLPISLQYIGGECKTFDVDPYLLCWFWLEELAINCGIYSTIEQIHT